jgi:hypothetical protein
MGKLAMPGVALIVWGIALAAPAKCNADLLDQFRQEYPAAAEKLNAAYGHVDIQTSETLFDDNGGVKWQFHCQYLREGKYFRKFQTFVSAGTSDPTYNAVRVMGGSSDKYFDIQKSGDEPQFRITAFGPIEDDAFVKRGATDCLPLYASCYADAIDVQQYISDPAVRLVSAKTVFRGGVSVVDIVADVSIAGEPHNQVQFYFFPDSWALAGFSWPELSGSMSPNDPHKSIEQRVEYLGNDPPQIKSIDRWETTTWEPESRLGESKISVDSIAFGPVNEEKFTLADLGVAEPAVPSTGLRMLWMLSINGPLLAGYGIVFWVVSRRKKRAGRSKAIS